MDGFSRSRLWHKHVMHTPADTDDRRGASRQRGL